MSDSSSGFSKNFLMYLGYALKDLRDKHLFIAVFLAHKITNCPRYGAGMNDKFSCV
jgi:hypothetical protein